MEDNEDAMLNEAMEQQQVKSVTLESMQTVKAASSTQEASTEAISAANVQHTTSGSKGGPETPFNAAVCCSPTSSPTRHKQHGSSHKSKHKHSKVSRAEESSSSSDNAGTDNEPLVRKKHGGIKAWRYPGLQSTSSYRQLTTVGSCHQYTISGYKLANALGPGTCLRSDLFEAGGQSFQLEVFPAGLCVDTPNHLALFLTTPGSVNRNHVLYELAVVDQSGRGRHLLRASKPNRHGPSNSLQTGVVAGYPCFVRTALLQQHQSRYLLNDSLVIRVTVEAVRSWTAAPQQLAVPGSLYSPVKKQQLPQQPSVQDAVIASCYSTQPGFQDRVVTTCQQQTVANQQPQLQAGFGSQPCMCPACYVINTVSSNTAAAGSAALTCTGSCTSPPDQQPAQLCNCPGCAAAAAATAAAEGLRRHLASTMQQQQPGGESPAPSECSCTACNIQKLLQLLPALVVNLQLAAGTEGVAAGSADKPQQMSPADGTAAAAAAVPAATADARPATSNRPMAPAGADAVHKLLSQDAAVLASTTCQLAQLLLLLQQQQRLQMLQQQQRLQMQQPPSCCTCTNSSSRAWPATSTCSVCGERAKLVSTLQQQQQQQQQWAGVRPARACTAAQSPSKLVSSTCSYEVGSPCSYSSMLEGNEPLLQGQQQLAQQQRLTRQCPPVLEHQQHWSPQQQHFAPAAPVETKSVVRSPVRLGEVEALQQVDTAGLAVPLVRHHPTRVAYM